MKTSLVLAALLCLAVPALAGDYPVRPSLLMMVEGQTADVEAKRPGIYRSTDNALSAGFSALLELPASPKSSILIKAGLGRRVDDVNAFSYLGAARITRNYANFGFGVRLFLK